jgi:hypothetical protein
MNIVLSKNNHLTLGYNNIPNSRRATPYDKFYLNFKKTEYIPKSFRDECVKTACEISDFAESKNLIPLILYQRNASSEIILASFLESKKKFRLATINFSSNSDLDTDQRIEELKKKYNLDTEVFIIDIEKYLDDEKILSISKRDNVYDVKNYLFAFFTDKIKKEFFPIANSLDLEMYRNNTDLNFPSEWFLQIKESSCSYYFHYLNEHIDACPSFNLWSPEIFLSFLKDQQTDSLIKNKSLGKVSLKTTALKVYRNAFPNYDFGYIGSQDKIEKKIQSKINLFNKNLRISNFYDKHSSAEFFCDDLILTLSNQHV